MTSALTAGGLLLDIAGAVLLAMSFMTKTPRQAYRETETYVGNNPVLYVSLAKQTADAWVGGGLLACGFGAQLVDSVMSGQRPSLGLTLPIGAAVAVVAITLLFFLVRPFLVRRAIESALTGDRAERVEDPSEKAVQKWWATVESWGEHVGSKRGEGESLDQFGRRMLGRRRWERLTEDIPPPSES